MGICHGVVQPVRVECAINIVTGLSGQSCTAVWFSEFAISFGRSQRTVTSVPEGVNPSMPPQSAMELPAPEFEVDSAEVGLRIKCGGTTAACCRDGLAVGVIDQIPAREDPRFRGTSTTFGCLYVAFGT